MAEHSTSTSTDPGAPPHRLPEGPVEWRLDELSRQRGRAGIALAREMLRAGLERRARRDAAPGRLDLVA